MNTPSKIVVFDMDETLGYFVELSIFWDALITYIKEINISHTTSNSFAKATEFPRSSFACSSGELQQKDFNKILDLYPEFIRPNILTILNYLKYKKKSGECAKIMIYTNNQGPKQWALYIKQYFENKIKYGLFDQIICAFKVNGKQLELGRTTHDKTFSDFIKCSKVPTNTQICFLDDTYYPNMNNDNVYYIKVKPYMHDLSHDLLIKRFISSDFGKTILKDKKEADAFNTFMKQFMMKYDYTYVEKKTKDYDIDKIVTKKTMIHLQDFFNKHNKTAYPTLKFKNTQQQQQQQSRKHKLVHNKTLKNRR